MRFLYTLAITSGTRTEPQTCCRPIPSRHSSVRPREERPDNVRSNPDRGRNLSLLHSMQCSYDTHTHTHSPLPPDADRGLSRDKSSRRVKLATSLHAAMHLTITFQSPSTASFHSLPMQYSLITNFRGCTNSMAK